MKEEGRQLNSNQVQRERKVLLQVGRTKIVLGVYTTFRRWEQTKAAIRQQGCHCMAVPLFFPFQLETKENQQMDLGDGHAVHTPHGKLVTREGGGCGPAVPSHTCFQHGTKNPSRSPDSQNCKLLCTPPEPPGFPSGHLPCTCVTIR